MSESDNAGAPLIPPLGHRASHPDATAPDGSQIRLLLDERHRAQKASMVEVVLPAGQVSRPVRHQSGGGGLVRLGRPWPSLALPARRGPQVGPATVSSARRRLEHSHRMELPVQHRPRRLTSLPLRHHPALAGGGRGGACGRGRTRPAFRLGVAEYALDLRLPATPQRDA